MMAGKVFGVAYTVHAESGALVISGEELERLRPTDKSPKEHPAFQSVQC